MHSEPSEAFIWDVGRWGTLYIISLALFMGALIAAAREVMYANSYEAVTVDELRAAAGMTKSSFYHFFSSKQELVRGATGHRSLEPPLRCKEKI